MIQKGNLIIADNGYILTDGGVYATVIDLGECKTINDYREVTVEEYNKILEEKVLNDE